MLVTRGEEAIGEGKMDTENQLYSERWKPIFGGEHITVCTKVKLQGSIHETYKPVLPQ